MILAVSGREEEREFRLGWSLFRRAHQAVAKRCHQASHAAREVLRRTAPPSRPAMTGTAAASGAFARLNDEQWERVKPLLPRHPPPSGPPGCDHRRTLDGLRWVLGSGASWQDLPEEEFGPWETVYGRYRRWCREGRWQQVVEALWPGEANPRDE